MLVVDDMASISEWGHNFRPDYFKLPGLSAWAEIPLVLRIDALQQHVKVKLDMYSFDIAPGTHSANGILSTQFRFWNCSACINAQEKNAFTG